MAPARALTGFFVPIIGHANRRQDVCRRCISSLPPSKGKGPLAGIRVLDMTRVLAGVRSSIDDFLREEMDIMEF